MPDIRSGHSPDIRNCELYNVCDISMCCNMDLTMYSNIYEDCVVNPRRDKC